MLFITEMIVSCTASSASASVNPPLSRGIIDEAPIRVEKDLPVLLVAPVFEPAQERAPGRNQFLSLPR